MTEIEINDIERLPQAAAQFIGMLRQGTVYAFRAPMGAGKTTLIAEICRQLESADEPNSPTFSIVNVYDTSKAGRIYHLDCYRLEDEEQGMEIGVEEYFNSGSICFVEWPERIEGLLPDDAIDVSISVSPSGSRILKIGITE